MPILNPLEAYYLTEYSSNNKPLKIFFTTYLPIASKNILLNKNTIQIYEKFTQLLTNHFQDFSSLLHITIPKMAGSLSINYYENFLKIINANSKEDNDQKYEIWLKNDFDSLNVSISNDNYSIFISSLSYAIVTLRNFNHKKVEKRLLLLFCLILAASGHILVLVASDDVDLSTIEWFLRTSLFSESHIFRSDLNNFPISFLNSITNKYIYIYDRMTKRRGHDSSELRNPFVKIFFISCSFKKAFENYSESFSISKIKFPMNDKFEINRIPINIYNYQVFDSDDLKKFWIPKKVEKFNKVFICADDFMDWFGKRIMFFTRLLEDEFCGYIDYNEIHYLKIDHHVSNPLYTMKIDYNVVDLIDEVKDNISCHTKLLNFAKSKHSNVEKYVAEKILYAYRKIYKHWPSKNGPIIAYPNQIYAVQNAIEYLSKNENKDDHKGCIYQVKTGEGKSIIICALAEIFARMGKTVHVVTSNIVLACRDYEKSYEYFTSCKFKSAILLHKKEFDEIKCEKMNTYYPSSNQNDYYHESSFINSSNMNIKVFEKPSYFAKPCEIVFSTFFNFEGWFMREMEDHEAEIQEYMNNCYLIIDESDTILIDELTNGTIIAREMKSNAKDILEKVYDLYRFEGKNASQILKAVKSRWPECTDIKLYDIKSMLNDIDYAELYEEKSKYVIKEENGEENIIPFDSEHKGITEKDKEFSGFIHQFVAIKEKRKNPSRNIVIKPLSISYLFISHPIFVRQYKGVWGFTGTIGTEKEKEILRKYYNLDTVIIPDHGTNCRKDLPTVICSDIKERNQKIIDEIKWNNMKQYPVLVIVEKINEIEDLKEQIQNYINDANILIFDGTNLDKKQIEECSGCKGAITLGTNFCGRGTDIDYSNEYPLHVIISYGPRNARALGQAYGRTGRNGKAGTTRIICTKNAFHKVTKIPHESIINNILDQYELKKKLLSLFINPYKSVGPWIFNPNIIHNYCRQFNDSEKEDLRDTIINVNRLTAINYKFPLCMKYKTYHKIQVQRIYSLKNCPECISTWTLYQRYIRELILETWSIFIDKVTKKYEYKIDQNEKDFMSYFQEEFDKLQKYMMKNFFFTYFYNIQNSFMEIHQIVKEKWNDKIMNSYPEELRDFHKISNNGSFMGYKTGFFPYEIKNKFGHKIYKANARKCHTNYIEDPELRYLRDGNKFSITQIIDDIFDAIFNSINDKLSKVLDINLYVRRTVSGCEFGLCIDPLFDDIYIDDYHCLIDKTPLLICSIICKSIKPVMAGILLIILVFITLIAVAIANYFAKNNLPILNFLKSAGSKISNVIKKQKKIMKTCKLISDALSIKKILIQLIKWLHTQIFIQVHKNFADPIMIIANTILGMLDPKQFKETSKDENQSIKFNKAAKELFKKTRIPALLLKIAILFVLLISAFIKNFQPKNELTTTASAYQSEHNTNKKKEESDFYFIYMSSKSFEEYNILKNVKKDVKENTYFSDISSDDDIEIDDDMDVEYDVEIVDDDSNQNNANKDDD